MTDQYISISGLPLSQPLTGSEVLPMDQGPSTVQATAQQIANLAPRTNLGYDPATRTLTSSTGEDVEIPEASAIASGLLPAAWISGASPALFPHIHGNLAGVVYQHVRNVSGAVMPALTPYHVVGNHGDTDTVTIVPADASDPQTMPASGITMTELAASGTAANGHGATAGVPTGVNTAGNSSGTVLYVGAGVLTPTPPAANVQALAIVGRSHATTGTLAMLSGPALARVAYSGDYNHLANKPTLGSAAAQDASAFAPAAQGVSNGNSHDHSGGDGAQIAYGSLSGLPGNFTSTTAGMVPASGGGTSNFLRADGTFAAPPTGGTPGDTSGQLQYNNAGTFAGVPNTSVDPATGNTTFSARWINARNGAANAPADTMTGTWFTGGTTTSTKPHFLIEPSTVTVSNNWSTAGTGFGVNAPSGFAGNLLDLQVNGVRACSITQSQVFIPQGSEAAPGLAVGATSSGIVGIGSGTQNLGIVQGGLNYINLSGGTVRMPSGVSLGWCNSAVNQAAPDLLLFRDTANTLAQQNGTAAQASRIYNTFTSATNFERLNIRWTSNEAIIDTEAGSGGGTLRGLKIGSASTSLLGFYGATPVTRGVAIPDATDLASALTSLNALLARTRAEGRIAT